MPPPLQVDLTSFVVDLLSTLEVVSESRVTLATSVPILDFLCLSVLDLGPMYARGRQTDRRQTVSSLNAPA